ncbi:MAG: tetratricopeptide repeat protein [Cyanobacteria bacterium J06641_5]
MLGSLSILSLGMMACQETSPPQPPAEQAPAESTDTSTDEDTPKEAQGENLKAIVESGKSLFAEGKYEDALAEYDRALEIDPNRPQVWLGRGRVQQKLKQLEDALESYDRAIEIQPEYAAAYRNRGLVLRASDRPEAAIESLQKAADLFAAQGREELAEAILNVINKIKESSN